MAICSINKVENTIIKTHSITISRMDDMVNTEIPRILLFGEMAVYNPLAINFFSKILPVVINNTLNESEEGSIPALFL